MFIHGFSKGHWPRLSLTSTRRGPRHACLSSPQGTNELTVFVDLASISAGENDIDVDRVACFHDAVQGYTSLLYKLHANAGFPEFMSQLKELWKALENDPHLPSKLVRLTSAPKPIKSNKTLLGSVRATTMPIITHPCGRFPCRHWK